MRFAGGVSWYCVPSSQCRGFSRSHDAVARRAADKTGAFLQDIWEINVSPWMITRARPTIHEADTLRGTSEKDTSWTNVAERKDLRGASSSHSYQHNDNRLLSCSISFALILCMWVFSHFHPIFLLLLMLCLFQLLWASNRDTILYDFWQKVRLLRRGGRVRTCLYSELRGTEGGEWMRRGDNSNSFTESEDALKREPLLPIVCLPFWKSRVREVGYRVGRYPRLLFQFLLPARQTSTFLSFPYSPALPIVYVQTEGLMQKPIKCLTYLCPAYVSHI